MLSTRAILTSAVLIALAVGCKQSEFGGDAPVQATQKNVSADNTDGNDQNTDQNSRDQDLTSRDDESDADNGRSTDIAQRCEEKNGTYVKGKGCYVCEDERQTYDVEEEKCMPELSSDESGSKVGGVVNILDTIFKSIPTTGTDGDDPFGDDVDCDC